MLDTNKLTRAYVKMREARAALKRDFDVQDKALRAQQSLLEATMLRVLHEANADSVRTESGTFYRQEDVTPRGDDWDAFYAWVVETNGFDALERRIKKTFIREYMELHEGALPPGVSVYREYVARVRQA